MEEKTYTRAEAEKIIQESIMKNGKELAAQIKSEKLEANSHSHV